MLYQKLYEEIKERILDGRLRPGQKLPGKRQLAADRGVSINTVVSALGQLEAEGYVYSRQRSGVYVLNQKLTLREPDLWPRQETAIDQPLIDWRYRGVDGDFPRATWRKLGGQIMADRPDLFMETGDRQGEQELREALSTYLWSSRGVEAPASHIVIDSSTESLLLTLLAMLGKPTIGLEDPGFHRWGSFLHANLVRRLPLRLDEEGAVMSPSDKKEADLIFITPAHQFPTGRIMSIGRKQELLDWAAAHGKWIIEDDYNGEFRFEGKPIPPIKAIDGSDRVIYMGSFSATISPAMRVSYMVLPDRLVSRFRKNSYYLSSRVPRLTQLIVARFMTSGSFIRHINRMRRKYARKHQLLTDWISEKPGLAVRGSKAGLHLLLEYRGGNRSESELTGLAESRGMALSPLSDYELIPQQRRPAFVVGYGKADMDQLRAGINLLEEVWKL